MSRPEAPSLPLPLRVAAASMGAAYLVHKCWVFRDERDAAERNVILLQQLRQESLNDALHDDLTGVLNGAGLKNEFESLRANHNRHTDDNPLLVAVIDVDDFKEINDNEEFGGHDVGDQVLAQVAGALGSDLRSDDVLGRSHENGDEFVAYLRRVSIEDCLRVVERMRANVEALKATSPLGDMSPTVTIGLAEVDLDDKKITFETMLKDADRAMYIAKREGRNRVRLLRQPGISPELALGGSALQLQLFE